MKKKITKKIDKVKLFFSLSVISVAIALLCFGVFAALNVTYTLDGEISYQIQDAYVKVNTTLYQTTQKLDIRQKNAIVEQLSDPSTLSSVTSQYNLTKTGVSNSFSTLSTTNPPSTNYSLDFGEDITAFVFVINVQNLTDNNAWAVIDTVKAKNSLDISSSNVDVVDNFQLKIAKDSVGKNLVIVVSPKNGVQNIASATSFSFGIVFGSMSKKSDGSISYNYVDSQTNLSKINISASNVVTKVSSNITGVVEIPGNCTLNSTSFSSSKLYHVIVDNGQNSFNGSSFGSCSYLQSLSLPASVTSLSNIDGCARFQRVSIDSNNTMYKVEGNCLIEKSSNTLILGMPTSVIPNTVTSINAGAFYGSRLTSITIPSSVTSIGSQAFGKSDLISVEIPGSVSTIYYETFVDCLSLESVLLPNTITSIGEHAFCNCRKLQSINIPESVILINNHAFDTCFSLNNIIIKNKETVINEYAFANCQTLVSVDLEVQQISQYAFSTCPMLERVTIDCEIIKYNVFEDCYRLRYVTLKEGLQFIDEGAFRNCIGLLEITIPSTVIEIAHDIFYGCTALSNITIKSNCYIDKGIFSGCDNISTLDISASKIAQEAFYKNTTLQTVVIRNALTIDESAFEDCTNLQSVTTYNVGTIGVYAFFCCTSLLSIDINAKYIEAGAFKGSSALQSVILRDVESLGATSFGGCSSLQSVTILSSSSDSGLKTIDFGAFADCTSLTSFVIPSSVTSIGTGIFDNCKNLTQVKFEETTGWKTADDKPLVIAEGFSKDNASLLMEQYNDISWTRS